MVAHCPTCGQPLSSVIMKPNYLLAILRSDSKLTVYQGRDYNWYVSHGVASGRTISKDAIDTLVARGEIRRTYSQCDGSYGTAPTIDEEATMAWRKMHKRKDWKLVYVSAPSP